MLVVVYWLLFGDVTCLLFEGVVVWLLVGGVVVVSWLLLVAVCLLAVHRC